MLGNSNRHTILIISMCAHVRHKKSDNSLSRVSKQVHLSLMEEGRRERAMRRNTRPSMGSMLWWKWVCAHPVDWQARRKM